MGFLLNRYVFYLITVLILLAIISHNPKEEICSLKNKICLAKELAKDQKKQEMIFSRLESQSNKIQEKYIRIKFDLFKKSDLEFLEFQNIQQKNLIAAHGFYYELFENSFSWENLDDNFIVKRNELIEEILCCLNGNGLLFKYIGEIKYIYGNEDVGFIYRISIYERNSIAEDFLSLDSIGKTNSPPKNRNFETALEGTVSFYSGNSIMGALGHFLDSPSIDLVNENPVSPESTFFQKHSNLKIGDLVLINGYFRFDKNGKIKQREFSTPRASLRSIEFPVIFTDLKKLSNN